MTRRERIEVSLFGGVLLIALPALIAASHAVAG